MKKLTVLLSIALLLVSFAFAEQTTQMYSSDFLNTTNVFENDEDSYFYYYNIFETDYINFDGESFVNLNLNPKYYKNENYSLEGLDPKETSLTIYERPQYFDYSNFNTKYFLNDNSFFGIQGFYLENTQINTDIETSGEDETKTVRNGYGYSRIYLFPYYGMNFDAFDLQLQGNYMTYKRPYELTTVTAPDGTKTLSLNYDRSYNENEYGLTARYFLTNIGLGGYVSGSMIDEETQRYEIVDNEVKTYEEANENMIYSEETNGFKISNYTFYNLDLDSMKLKPSIDVSYLTETREYINRDENSENYNISYSDYNKLDWTVSTSYLFGDIKGDLSYTQGKDSNDNYSKDQDGEFIISTHNSEEFTYFSEITNSSKIEASVAYNIPLGNFELIPNIDFTYTQESKFNYKFTEDKKEIDDKLYYYTGSPWGNWDDSYEEKYMKINPEINLVYNTEDLKFRATISGEIIPTDETINYNGYDETEEKPITEKTNNARYTLNDSANIYVQKKLFENFELGLGLSYSTVNDENYEDLNDDFENELESYYKSTDFSMNLEVKYSF